MLHHLRIAGFRCFDLAEIHPCTGTNFFVGENASGKTSLIEAVCILLRLQSPRASTIARCARFGGDAFHLDGHLEDRRLEFRWKSGSRTLLVDSVVQPGSAYYVSSERVTWFANDDLALVRGPGTGRRRLLDFIGSQLDPAYASSLRSYERALRARNFLLRQERPRREIDAYSAPLVEHGERIRNGRTSFFQSFSEAFAAAASDIAGTSEHPSLRFECTSSGDFAQALAASKPEEERLRQTLVGPHRDDFAVLFDDRPAAEFASEGQQRTLALALKLAQSRLLASAFERPPLLLLDDIFGELDAGRRNRLLASLPHNSQKWITTTFLDWYEPGITAGAETVFTIAGQRIEQISSSPPGRAVRFRTHPDSSCLGFPEETLRKSPGD